jgi:hypothetical protein
MSIFFRAAIILSCIASPAFGAHPQDRLAQVTGVNLGILSAKLSQHQREMNSTMSQRIENVGALARLAANAQFTVERELTIMSQTEGGELVDWFNQVREGSDKAAAVPAQLDAAQLQAKTDILALYAPLAISTESIDASAKALAKLSKEKTRGERAAFFISYFKELRGEINTLKQQSEDSKSKADAAAETQASEAIKKTALLK